MLKAGATIMAAFLQHAIQFEPIRSFQILLKSHLGDLRIIENSVTLRWFEKNYSFVLVRRGNQT